MHRKLGISIRVSLEVLRAKRRSKSTRIGRNPKIRARCEGQALRASRKLDSVVRVMSSVYVEDFRNRCRARSEVSNFQIFVLLRGAKVKPCERLRMLDSVEGDFERFIVDDFRLHSWVRVEFPGI